jgi:hypothetical protein
MKKNTLKPHVFTLYLAVALIGLGGFQGLRAQTAPPAFSSYQGFLVDNNGQPLGNPTPVNRELQFHLFTDAGAGTHLWGESHIATVNRGYFSVQLGKGQVVSGVDHDPLNDLFKNNANVFLETRLVGQGTEPNTIIQPRMQFLTSPFAFSADHAKTATAATTAVSAGSASSATTAGHANTANSASSATNAGHANTANSASSAGSAHQLTDTLGTYLNRYDTTSGQVVLTAAGKQGFSFFGGKLRVRADGNSTPHAGRGVMLQFDVVGSGNDWNHVVQLNDTTPAYSIYYGTTERMWVSAENSNGWTVPSDRRLKKNFEYQSAGWLDRLEEINPVWYNMKTDPDGAPKQFGVIAQDVEKVLPAAVSKNGGYLGVSYSALGVAAIGGVKELSKKTDKEISALKEENQQLKDTLDQLMKRLQALENQVQ